MISSAFNHHWWNVKGKHAKKDAKLLPSSHWETVPFFSHPSDDRKWPFMLTLVYFFGCALLEFSIECSDIFL